MVKIRQNWSAQFCNGHFVIGGRGGWGSGGFGLWACLPGPKRALWARSLRPAGFNRTWARRTYRLGVLSAGRKYGLIRHPPPCFGRKNGRRYGRTFPIGRPKVRCSLPLIGEVRLRRTSHTGSHTVCGRGTRLLVWASGAPGGGGAPPNTISIPGVWP